ncbi:helix-turn-helix domain-containing protein [Kribbella sp.]|uniref:TetR/AcrR family transcriptional regulator n=1 Tax=Kribbella sp. TaxID=1871183 RepID=UPI002D279D33|nr:helix-turn-helix domain-containing protein [Kribbella sp.]HZX05066.1 helix-turn-helix domain-containing protein [Kribbella sp.]
MPDDETPGRTYRKAAARRAQILSRAIELFAERGVGASLRAIGEAIGVSHAALRYYFASRDELLVEVYREHEVREHQELPGDASAVAVMIRSAESNRAIPGLVELYATLTTEALQSDRHPAAHRFVVDRFRAVRAELAERIRTAQRDQKVASDIDPVDAAALAVAASDGLQLQWLLEPDAVDVSRVLRLLERLLPGAAADHDFAAAPDDEADG